MYYPIQSLLIPCSRNRSNTVRKWRTYRAVEFDRQGAFSHIPIAVAL